MIVTARNLSAEEFAEELSALVDEVISLGFEEEDEIGYTGWSACVWSSVRHGAGFAPVRYTFIQLDKWIDDYRYRTLYRGDLQSDAEIATAIRELSILATAQKGV